MSEHAHVDGRMFLEQFAEAAGSTQSPKRQGYGKYFRHLILKSLMSSMDEDQVKMWMASYTPPK